MICNSLNRDPQLLVTSHPNTTTRSICLIDESESNIRERVASWPQGGISRHCRAYEISFQRLLSGISCPMEPRRNVSSASQQETLTNELASSRLWVKIDSAVIYVFHQVTPLRIRWLSVRFACQLCISNAMVKIWVFLLKCPKRVGIVKDACICRWSRRIWMSHQSVCFVQISAE